MEHSLEFKNIEKLDDLISADIYIDGVYVVKLSDSVRNINVSKDSDVKIVSYFHNAMKHYLHQLESYDFTNQLFNQSTTSIN
jgi:hypothetical protein